MKKAEIYIFGHKNPDTDSITSAITLSYLKNQLGYNTIPAALGGINRETRYALKYFSVDEPRYIDDVRLQIKDIDYRKRFFVTGSESIYGAYQYMLKHKTSNVPLIDKNQYFVGTISMKDIAEDFIDGDFIYLRASYNNILKTLNAKKIVKIDDEIEGDIVLASYRSTTFMEEVPLNEKSILIVGDRHSIIEHAINKRVKMIIVTNDCVVKPQHIELALKNGVNIVTSAYGGFKIAILVNSCSYVETLSFNKSIIKIDESTFVHDFVDLATKTKFTNFPVVDVEGKILGVISLDDVSANRKKKVILVDHNEPIQSVDNLAEAEILEIVDHHNISSLVTTKPISFRNMPVGSTNTIIYNMYKENNVQIPKEMAGLMLSGLISDTLLLKSPTTTEHDKKIVDDLCKIAGVDFNKYGIEMLKAGSSLKGKTADEVLLTDFKKFTVDGQKVGISQASTFNINEFKSNIDEYIKIINDIALNQNYAVFAFFITDVLNNGSYIYFNDSAKLVLSQSFNMIDLQQGTFIKGIVSRKKQVIPRIINFMES